MVDEKKYVSLSRPSSDVLSIPRSSTVLKLYEYLLPQQGDALDLACGIGGNAFNLARHGLQTHAWDISASAIEQVDNLSKKLDIPITTQIHDVENNFPENKQFDVIVVSRFLFRPLFPTLIHSLKENGLLYYQTFIKDKPKEQGPKNPDYLLGRNELLQLCNGLIVRAYHEEGTLAANPDDRRIEAMIVAQKSSGCAFAH